MAITNISAVIGNGITLLDTTQTRKTNFLTFQGTTFNLNFPVYNFDGTPFNLTGWYPKGAMSINVYDQYIYVPLIVTVVGDPSNGIINWYIDYATSLTLRGGAIYDFNIDIYNGLNNLDWNSTPYMWENDTFPWSPTPDNTIFIQRILEGNLTVETGVNY